MGRGLGELVSKLKDRGPQYFHLGISLHWEVLSESEFGILADVLRHCPQCKSVRLVQVKLNEAALKVILPELIKMKDLEELDFTDNRIEDEGALLLAKALPSFSQLKKLQLRSGGLTEAGAKAIAEALTYCPQLTTLDLSQSMVQDGGAIAVATALQKLPKITDVNLSGTTGITRIGVDALAAVIPLCPAAVEFHLAPAPGYERLKELIAAQKK